MSLALRRKLSELEIENSRYKKLYGLLRDTPLLLSSEHGTFNTISMSRKHDLPIPVLSY